MNKEANRQKLIDDWGYLASQMEKGEEISEVFIKMLYEYLFKEV